MSHHVGGDLGHRGPTTYLFDRGQQRCLRRPRSIGSDGGARLLRHRAVDGRPAGVGPVGGDPAIFEPCLDRSLPDDGAILAADRVGPEEHVTPPEVVIVTGRVRASTLRESPSASDTSLARGGLLGWGHLATLKPSRSRHNRFRALTNREPTALVVNQCRVLRGRDHRRSATTQCREQGTAKVLGRGPAYGTDAARVVGDVRARRRSWPSTRTSPSPRSRPVRSTWRLRHRLTRVRTAPAH